MDEADGRVSVAVSSGTGYTVAPDAGSAGVDVYDNDVAGPVETTVTTLWSAALEWTEWNGVLIAYADDFTDAAWSEDGNDFTVWYFSYDPFGGALWLKLNTSRTDGDIARAGQLTLHLGDETVPAGDVLSAFAAGGIGTVDEVWRDWDVGDRVPVRLTRTEAAADATAALPGLSVANAEVREAADAALSFGVTLGAAQGSAVSVRYATSDGTASAGLDYEAVSGMLRFEPGETAKTVSVPVIDDDHDEGSETLTLALSQPFGATISGGAATGTITNTDPMPRAWIARFGRTVAAQVLEAVERRMTAPRGAGVEVTLGGRRIGGASAANGAGPGGNAAPAAAWQDPADRFGPDTGPERRLGLDAQTMTQRDFLLGSSFSFTGGTARDGAYALWGRAATTRFDGQAGALSLEGEVTSGMLGADWSRDALMAGLVVSRSLGEGGYGGEGGHGAVSSSLTGLYPWGRFALSERLSVWGVAGYGEGALTLTPAGGTAIDTDLDLRMAAAGLRGVMVPAPETGGLELAVTSDLLGVQTRTAKAQGLAAEAAGVTRLRLGLEGARAFRFEGGASLTPSVELGVRRDGGDAETGFGVDIGGGIAWSDPRRGLAAEVLGRGLLGHEADGFRERGLSGSLSWDPTPETARGLSFSISQMVGVQAAGGAGALLERGTLAGLAANAGGAAQPRGAPVRDEARLWDARLRWPLHGDAGDRARLHGIGARLQPGLAARTRGLARQFAEPVARGAARREPARPRSSRARGRDQADGVVLRTAGGPGRRRGTPFAVALTTPSRASTRACPTGCRAAGVEDRSGSAALWARGVAGVGQPAAVSPTGCVVNQWGGDADAVRWDVRGRRHRRDSRADAGQLPGAFFEFQAALAASVRTEYRQPEPVQGRRCSKKPSRCRPATGTWRDGSISARPPPVSATLPHTRVEASVSFTGTRLTAGFRRSN